MASLPCQVLLLIKRHTDEPHLVLHVLAPYKLSHHVSQENEALPDVQLHSVQAPKCSKKGQISTSRTLGTFP